MRSPGAIGRPSNARPSDAHPPGAHARRWLSAQLHYSGFEDINRYLPAPPNCRSLNRYGSLEDPASGGSSLKSMSSGDAGGAAADPAKPPACPPAGGCARPLLDPCPSTTPALFTAAAVLSSFGAFAGLVLSWCVQPSYFLQFLQLQNKMWPWNVFMAWVGGRGGGAASKLTGGLRPYGLVADRRCCTDVDDTSVQQLQFINRPDRQSVGPPGTLDAVSSMTAALTAHIPAALGTLRPGLGHMCCTIRAGLGHAALC